VTIVLNHKKLLGYRILAGGNSSAKIGTKPGEKVGVKPSRVS
jgi:hypothetical protein